VVNKPAGVVSTAREPGSRPAVVSLVDSSARLYPVGRLDADSTGLLLLTNDGELANRLTHPRYEVAKAYRMELRRPPSERDLRRLADGVDLDDGMTAPAKVRRLGEREVEIVLREGRNRQVRRMAEAIGNEVVALRRVRFGPIGLGGLHEGKARRLSADEVAALREAGVRT
jgi:23S rRNA pseudouridine2605 synthase